MDRNTITNAQAFLTLETYEGRKRMVHIEPLLEIHEPETVLGFLNDLLREHQTKLRRLIKRDKTDPRVDQTVSRCFRIKMALNTLRNQLSVKEAA